MRHCANESVSVYEHESKSFVEVMREVASEAELLGWDDVSWFNVTIASDQDDNGNPIYRATLYVHS